MSSALVNKGLLYLAGKFGTVVAEGKPAAVMIGFLLGLGAGATVLFASVIGGILAAAFGGMMGAVIAAVQFPRPPISLASYTGSGDGELGKIIGTIVSDLKIHVHTIIVMEKALYVITDEKPVPESVFEKLKQGIHPQHECGNLIILSNIQYLEATNTQPGKSYPSITFHYYLKGQRRARFIEFGSHEEFDECIRDLENLIGRTFPRQSVPMETRRAVKGPMILLIIAGLLTIGLTLLSSHWRDDPPPPPRGKTETDSLVQGVIDFGPTGFLISGGALMALLLFWIYRRIVKPPMLEIFQVALPTKEVVGP